MFYEKKPRADVDVTAQNSGGVNLGGKPAIQMKGVTQPQTLAVKVFRWIKRVRRRLRFVRRQRKRRMRRVVP